jgi:hypothetical protein
MGTRVALDIGRRVPFAGGAAFEGTGAYESLAGRAHFSVDPRDPYARGITDLEHAAANERGLVEFVAELCILKPADPRRWNRRLLFEFCNRGNKRALQYFNDAPSSNTLTGRHDAGNGFLMRRGYAVVWAGWQGDLLSGDGRLCLEVPVARADGRPITGRVRTEFITTEPGVVCAPLSSDVALRSYPAASTNTADAVFTRRQYATSARISIPSHAWRYAKLERAGTQSALVPSDTHIYLREGFEPSWIYELIYPAKDPLVLGLGYLVARDLVSMLRYAGRDDASAPNPLGEGGAAVEKAYCWGRSQPARLIRDFVYRGFNADAAGRRVFDAVFPHVAGAGRMWLNHRWAQPARLPGLQHEDHYCYSDRFPFAYGRTTDHLTGQTDAILQRPETDPLVLHTFSSTEYWQRHESLVHGETRGRDLDPPDTVRCYFWAGSQHLADPLVEAPVRGVGQQLQNAVYTSPLFRALLDHLDRWATHGTPPPTNRMPRRADGTLVTAEEWEKTFPCIPGVVVPPSPNRLPLYDYGPDAERGHLAKDPPEPVPGGEEYPIFVPAVDADGNEIAGIRMPGVQVPRGTYTGWNIRTQGQSPGVLAELAGSSIPFPKTRAEREATGDPRPSFEERYGDQGAFLRATADAARRLVGEGFLLEEDYERVMRAAESRRP